MTVERAMPRVLKLTPKVAASIVKNIAAGVPRKYAAESVGVTVDCLFKWLRKGRKSKDQTYVYVSLFYAVKKADADSVARRVKSIDKAGKEGAWQAHAWHLERCHSGEFALNRREVKEMKDRLDAILKAIDSGKLVPAVDQQGGQGTRLNRPKVGGDADPESI